MCYEKFPDQNSQPIKLCCTVSLTGTKRNIHRLFVTADRQWNVHLSSCRLSQKVMLRTQVSAADTWCQLSLLVTWPFEGTPWAADVPLPLKPCGGSIARWSPNMWEFLLVVLSADINILIVSWVIFIDETKFGRFCVKSADNHQQ
jgi:hypothetical protein